MATGIVELGSNFPTPGLVADPVFSYPAQPGLPAAGPGGVAQLTTVVVAGVTQTASIAWEIQSTTGGFLPPRMTQAQRLALVPSEGMDVYESDTKARWWYLNGTWTQVNTGGGGGGNITGPVSSTLNAIVSWNNALGTVVKDNKALITTNGTDVNASDLTLVATIQASKTAGLIGSPNYSFTGDTNTGMWSSAAETIDFSTSGARQFQIANTAATTSWLAITGSAGTPGIPRIQALGTPGDISVLITPKGTNSGLAVSAGSGSAIGGTIVLLNNAGTAAVGFTADPALAGNIVWRLPSTDATSANQPLVSDGAGVLSFYSTALSSFVVGPASATDNAIVRYDGTTGKLVQNSVVTIDDTTGTTTLAANGQFIAGLGTNANPAFTFLGDTNTGLYRVAAESIGFTTNGELQFAIRDAAGTAVNTLYLQGAATTATATIGINTGAGDAVQDIALLGRGTSGGVRILGGQGGADGGIVKLYDQAGNNFSAWQCATAQAADLIYVLPATAPTAVNQVLTNQAGFASPVQLSWADNTILSVTGTLAPADVDGMYGAPVLAIAAPGANMLVVPLLVKMYLDFNTTAYTAGGPILLQYGNTINGLGQAATTTTSAAAFTAGVATVGTLGLTAGAAAASNEVNTAIYFSNQTAAFATGDSNVKYIIYYMLIDFS